MGAGNSTSSKNVSKMMMKASINISTEIDQDSKTEAGGVNISTQDCTNVKVTRPPNTQENKDKKLQQLYQSCFNAGYVGNSMCALQPPTGDNPANILWKGGQTKTADYGQRVANEREARAWCSESEDNCTQCVSEGEPGKWMKQDPGKCLSYYGRDAHGNMVKCGWLADGEIASGHPMLSDVRAVPRVHCVPECKAATDAGTCNHNQDCKWKNGRCELSGTTLERFPKLAGEPQSTAESIGCAMKNISQINEVTVQASTMQDAAIQNVTKQDLKQNLKQVAIAMTKGISFGNTTSASNVGDMVANASTQISNKIKQTCGASGFGLNVVGQNCDQVSVEAGEGGGAGCVIDGVAQNNTMKIANDCTQKAVVSNKVIQDLQQTMDQRAVAKNTGVSFGIMGIIIFIVAVVFLLAMKKPKQDSYAPLAVLAANILVALIGALVFMIVALGYNKSQGVFHDFRTGAKKGWFGKEFYGPPYGRYTVATMNMKSDDAGWNHETPEGQPFGPGCYDRETNQRLEGVDTKQACRERKGKWDSKGHFPVDKAIATCAAAKTEAACEDADLDNEYATCEWSNVPNFLGIKKKQCIVDTADQSGWGAAGRAYAKKEGVLPAEADEACHADDKCNAWFWQSENTLDEMTAYSFRAHCQAEPGLSKVACNKKYTRSWENWTDGKHSIYLWMDGGEDPLIDAASGFSPDCWGDKMCCDKKECLESGSPVSEACKSCCPQPGFVAALIGKEGGDCEGATYFNPTAGTNCEGGYDMDKWDVKCSKCDPSKPGSKGTAYFYQQAPEQKTTDPPFVNEEDQGRRVLPIISCNAGITSWGGFKQPRNLDLFAISGFAAFVAGSLGAIITFIAMKVMKYNVGEKVAGLKSKLGK